MIDSPLLSVIAFALLALCAGYGLTAFAIRWFKTGFQDHANERSLHAGVTPKIGGLTMLPVLLLVVGARLSGEGLWLPVTGQPSFLKAPVMLWLVCALAIYVLCVANDRSTKELSALLRLSGFFAAAAALIFGLYTLGPEAFNELARTGQRPVPGGLALALLAGFMLLSTLAFTNFYNFMDGMDGLAGSMALTGFGVLACAASLSPLDQGRLLATACAGIALCNLAFLRWNWPKARIFMGDTGSTFLGFSAAALGWIGSLAQVWHWTLPFLVFFPFWFDATLTLTRRLLRGEKVWRAHREHLYQRAVLGLQGLSMEDRHRRVLLVSLALMLLSGTVALHLQDSWLKARPVPAGALLALLTAHLLVMAWADRLYRQHPDRANVRRKP